MSWSLWAVWEGDQFPHRETPGKKMPQAMVREDPLDEVVAQPRIGKPPLLLHREVGEAREERPREQADPILARHAGFRVGLDPLHTARWRVLLEDVAAQISAGEGVHPPRRE
jgi:hypothetical protein